MKDKKTCASSNEIFASCYKNCEEMRIESFTSLKNSKNNLTFYKIKKLEEKWIFVQAKKSWKNKLVKLQ